MGVSREEIVAAQYDVPQAARSYLAAYSGDGPMVGFFRSRMYAVAKALARVPGGELLDAGSGPGTMVRYLLQTRPGDFRITALDRSPTMAEACAGASEVRAVVGRIENMGFPDASFDVVLALGSLEYTEIEDSLRELARVVKPDGLVVVTMLNPVSPYRFVEWRVYRPLLRVAGRMERLFGVPRDRRHAAGPTGIRAYRERTLRRLMTHARLKPVSSTYFDVTPLVPPVDRLLGRRARPERTLGRGWRRMLGTAYLIAARPV